MKSQSPLLRSLLTIFWLIFLSNSHTLKTAATPLSFTKSEKKSQIPITIAKNNYFQISQTTANQLPSIKAETSAIFLFPNSPLITEKFNTKNNHLLNPNFSPSNPHNSTQKPPQTELNENYQADAGEPPSLRFAPQSKQNFAPSISVSMPFANGFSWGNAGIGLGLQSRTRYTNSPDGGLGIGIGLGNPQTHLGFDVVASILDLSDFGSRGSLSFKIHRNFDNDLAIAVGLQNAIIWGYTDAGTSVYGVVTKTFRTSANTSDFLSSIVVSAGLGGGQFRPESDINNNIESVGVFGSVALRVVEPLNAIAEWTGQDLTLGLSYVPFANTPLIITGGVTDLTGNAGDGSRYLLRLGYLFTF
ncbi:hypothetical protein NG798_14495 [Ancylothrix sp. C2]|uniref:hypothetical protein n=1 Tax=Ancylothrix sp. D3o TaxID=2953691 RepID=UPI0021BAEF7F|nr:hypothetical protein [Ancylothrix sp. D3o]MCT7951005.1 hypothetical protein [Ancylothrix sp. D3o]